jgi:hypothetical protein
MSGQGQEVITAEHHFFLNQRRFVRLSRAFAAGGEQAVSIPDLKMAVAKILSVLIAKLDPNKLQANKDIVFHSS